MTITLKQFVGATVTPKDDAILYDHMIQNNACGIITGCVPTWLNANNVSITAGRGVIRGRVFEIQAETIAVNLSATNTLGRLKIVIDVSNTTTPISFVSETASGSLPALVQEDINGNGTTYEMAICTYNVSSTAVSNLVDVRKILKNTFSAQVYTLTTSGWANNAQSLSIAGVTANSLIIAGATNDSASAYAAAGVKCSAQSSGSVTFTCAATPTVDLYVTVVVKEV